MITLSIDVTLLDKARFKEVTRKNGQKAIFCDLILIDTPASDYGDFMIKQSLSKEEREAKVELPIIGNAKNYAANPKPASRTERAATTQPETGTCPF